MVKYSLAPDVVLAFWLEYQLKFIGCSRREFGTNKPVTHCLWLLERDLELWMIHTHKPGYGWNIPNHRHAVCIRGG